MIASWPQAGDAEVADPDAELDVGAGDRARRSGAAWIAPSKSPVTRTMSDGMSAWVAAS